MKQNASSPNKLDGLYPLKKEESIHIKKITSIIKWKIILFLKKI